MIFKPAPFPDGKRALIATGLLIGLDLLLALVAYLIPVGTLPFLLLVAVILLWVPITYVAWRGWACLSLAYRIDRNAITLTWGPIRQVIPLGAIQEVRRGDAVTAMQRGRAEVHGPNGQIDALPAAWQIAGRSWREFSHTGPRWARGVDPMDCGFTASLPNRGVNNW